MKVKKCYIEGCVSSKSSNEITSLHKISKPDPDMHEKWVRAISVLNRQPKIASHPQCATICNKHFKSTDYQFPIGDPVKRLKKTAVPSLFPRNNQMSVFLEEDEQQKASFIITELDENNEQTIIDPSTLDDVPSIEFITVKNEDSNLKSELEEPDDEKSDNDEIDPTTPAMKEKPVTLPAPIILYPVKMPRKHYPGDFAKNVNRLPHGELLKYARILEAELKNKKIMTKRLRTQIFRQNAKIEKMKKLVTALRERKIIEVFSECDETIE